MSGLVRYVIAMVRDVLDAVIGEQAAAKESRSQLRWGIAGVVVSALALLAAGVVYAVPFGEHTYTADFRSSGGARSGDEVRIAGIKVGEVRSIRLVGDHVEVRFGIDRNVHVGDRSSVQLKMLTPIGGHYLSLSPAGENSLGDKHIPPELTRTPFELTDVIETATPTLREVDGVTLRATIVQVNQALAGQPDAIRNIVGNFAELSDVLADRSEQLDQALAVSDEYIGAVATDWEVLADFVRQLGIVAVVLGQRKVEVIQVFNLLRRLFVVIDRPVMAYGNSIEPSVAQLEGLFDKLVKDPSEIDSIVGGIKDFMAEISAMLGVDGVIVDQSAGVVRGICIPFEGKAC
ncbi:MlaD family protein [Nocardia sp. GCM10030253]|uniref:MlaD family protein n=1 Tax=Nocardia sp. GCM10030253 TaxID=3273404 RepID=UPI00363815B5